jgi:hypothetical protein
MSLEDIEPPPYHKLPDKLPDSNSFEKCKSYISFGYDTTMGRIYKHDGEYVVVTIDNIHIMSNGNKSMDKTANYIIKIFDKTNNDIDYTINYNKYITKKRKNKVKRLVETDTVTKGFIVSSLTYLEE